MAIRATGYAGTTDVGSWGELCDDAFDILIKALFINILFTSYVSGF
ncbi:hypothetical protein CRENPOLYSF2_500006 [Crenothrix polyspora]|uniref:Uncharacterized protein n=1 Tax=Crenothrix polyspora TaxID=360316 RepID=A0A1R4HG72_9GAMM|nr:hypothetical protein CRENPOLYSF2_500006 [Crenothrix polyspora]